MKITFWGTANARGIPVYGCECRICRRARTDASYRRHCSCLCVETQDTTLVVDAGRPDLVELLGDRLATSVLLSHLHEDHRYGLAGLKWSREVRTRVCGPEVPPAGSELAEFPGNLDFVSVPPFEPLTFEGIQVTPVPLDHGCPTFGYCLDDGVTRFAYLTDTRSIPKASFDFLKEWHPQHVAIDANDCGQSKSDPTHGNFDLATQLAATFSEATIYLIHLSDRSEAWLEDNSSQLSARMIVPRDGLVVG